MVGIDQRQIREWLKVSDAETVQWRLNSRRQTPESGDYWQEAYNLNSGCNWAIGTVLGVKKLRKCMNNCVPTSEVRYLTFTG